MRFKVSIATEQEEQLTAQHIHDFLCSYNLMTTFTPDVPILEECTQVDLGNEETRFDIAFTITEKQLLKIGETFIDEIYNN